jgi:hypothetical protein
LRQAHNQNRCTFQQGNLGYLKQAFLCPSDHFNPKYSEMQLQRYSKVMQWTN